MNSKDIKNSFQMKYYRGKLIKHISIWSAIMILSILLPIIAPKSSSVEKSIGIYFFLMGLITLIYLPFFLNYLVRYIKILRNYKKYVLLTGEFDEVSFWNFGTEYGMFCTIVVDDVRIRVQTDSIFTKKSIQNFLRRDVKLLYSPDEKEIVIINV